MTRIYHPKQLTARELAIVPTPRDFAVFAIQSLGGFIIIHNGEDAPDANPIRVYTGETYQGLCGYDGDRVYVEDAPGQTVLSSALHRVH